MAKRKIAERSVAADDQEATGSAQSAETARRVVHTKLLFWRVCEEKACKRARGCRGDVDACWRRWRPAVPDELMTRLRIAIQARVAGASVEEAIRAANEHVAAIEAALANARTPPNAETVPSAAPDNDPSPVDLITATAPRVRVI
jgi:hypothetical protein